jgi:uncharacterized membrane protein YccC
VSGLQRALVVGILMTTAGAAFGAATAASAGIAGLLVGIADLRQNPGARFRTMAAATVTMAVTTLITHLVSPWPSAIVVGLGVIAFGEGSSIAVHQDLPLVLQLNGIIVATALLTPEPTTSGPRAALVVLVAGGVQCAASALFAARRKVVREVEIVASTVEDVGAFLRALASDADWSPDSAVSARAERALQSMSAAEDVLTASDLGVLERDRLREVLLASDRLRLEGRRVLTEAGVSSRSDSGEGRAGRLAALACILGTGAEVLRSGPEGLPERVGLSWLSARTASGVGFEQNVSDATDRSEATAVSAFLSAVDAVADSRRWVRVRTIDGRDRTLRFKEALHPSGMPARFGLRLAGAALSAGLVGAQVGLTRAAWSVNACLSVLRPGGGPTTVRVVLRAAGNVLASVIVIVEAALLGGSRPAMVAAAVVFACLMYSLGPANYGIYGAMVTASVLSIVILTGANPQTVAVERAVDTMFGCGVALVAAFAVPTWSATRLPVDIADCSAAIGRHFGDVSDALRVGRSGRDLGAIRASGRQARDAISGVLTTLQAVSVEPERRVPVEALRAVFEDLRSCAQAGVVVDHDLEEGAPPSSTGAAQAEAIATMLNRLAATIGDHPAESSPSDADAASLETEGSAVEQVAREPHGGAASPSAVETTLAAAHDAARRATGRAFDLTARSRGS